jgi:hypothetical protein
MNRFLVVAEFSSSLISSAFKPLSSDRCIQSSSSYRAVNTFYLGYKNQSDYAVSGTSRCLLSDKHKTHKYSFAELIVFEC